MSALSLSLFGRFQAILNGAPLAGFRTIKVQALLIYLAAEPPMPHRRESLMTLLWPGMPERSARQNLRQIIYNLRRAIPELPQKGIDGEIAGDTAVPLLLANRHTIQLNLDDSNAYEEWAEVKRQGYRRQALDALETLTTIATREAAYVEARGYAERQLEIDDLRESAYRQLMKILALNGQRAEALALYETLERQLAEELGMAPAARTTERYEQIRAGDMSFSATGAREVRGLELKEKIGEGTYGAVHRAVQPTVGREVAVKVIRRRYADDPEFIRRFEAEARVIARLEHPYIVPLYDYWRDPQGAYLVMRLLRGGNLLTSLQSGPWDIEPTLKMVDQITSALASAHC
ncbi:MAG: BTAD domain-containing putative transcriptional regulator, partial [Chloroflexota bacterium]